MSSHDLIIISVVYVLGSILSGILQGIWPTPNPNEKRLAQLERKVNRILEHLGIEQDPILDKVQESIVLGRHLQAIKLYREQRGVSLVAAKEAVLNMEAQMTVADNQESKSDRECRKKAKQTLAQLQEVRQRLQSDRRLSIILIKPFVLYQVYKAERKLREMT